VLEYRVKSSDKKRTYKVKFKGEGENLTASCTCPAFKHAGLFCKHVASLLNGNAELLVEPSSNIEELKKISANSGLLEKSKTYIPFSERKPKPLSGGLEAIEDVDSFIEPYLKDTGYWKEYEKKDDGSEYLTIYMQKYYKNGKPYKRPTTVSYLRYEPYVYSNWDREGKYHDYLVVCADKKMPYAVDGQAFGYLGPAGRNFLKKLKDDLNINIPDFTVP
jgi:hypothetical protein